MRTSFEPAMAVVFGVLIYPATLCLVSVLARKIGLDSFDGWQGLLYGLGAAIPLTLVSAACIGLYDEGNGVLARCMGGFVDLAGAVILVVAMLQNYTYVVGLMPAFCWCAALILGAAFSKRSDWVK